ncbi:MAG: hypothetical protein J5507_00020 [Clostridia bacterium]|nr:hypothetical protein [Clostridia bacterium]
MKKQNGITLIALIITIIVMLILVAVTINVALNGGLFDKAENAKNLTQKEVEREELISIAMGLYDIDSGITQNELVTELSKLNNNYVVDTDKTAENFKYVVTAKSGTIWEINLKTAEVKEYKKQDLGYSFKLSDLDNAYIETDSDSVSYFDISLLDSNIFGEELFAENSKYMYIDPPLFYLKSDSNDIVDDIEENKGNAKFVITALIESNNFAIQILSTNENEHDIIIQTGDTQTEDYEMTWAQFVEKYSNVTFTFQDLSGVSYVE